MKISLYYGIIGENDQRGEVFMRITKTLSTVLILAGICGLLSSLVQFIVFNDMPPTLMEVALGVLLIAGGLLIRSFHTDRNDSNTKK